MHTHSFPILASEKITSPPAPFNLDCAFFSESADASYPSFFLLLCHRRRAHILFKSPFFASGEMCICTFPLKKRGKEKKPQRRKENKFRFHSRLFRVLGVRETAFREYHFLRDDRSGTTYVRPAAAAASCKFDPREKKNTAFPTKKAMKKKEPLHFLRVSPFAGNRRKACYFPLSYVREIRRGKKIKMSG